VFRELRQRYPIDCINAHQPFTIFGILKFLQKSQIPMVYTCHSLSFEEFKSRRGNSVGLKGPLYQIEIWCRKYIEKRVLQAADRIIVLSEFTKQKISELHKLGAKTISILPGGVDLYRFHFSSDKTETRRRLNFPLHKFILFTVRNLVPRMGLENLIRAVDIIVKEVPDILLVLGGVGPLENSLKQLLQETGTESCIELQGFIPEDELPAYYRMADAFILPTQELEGFGLVSLEALASGLPVFGTPVGGTSEILSQLHEEYLFEDSSPEGMAKSIIRYYYRVKQNPALEKKVSIRCRDFAEKNYSWDKNINALESIFVELTRN
jgi:glycosyltransferase involved in cell wall biosynthesis